MTAPALREYAASATRRLVANLRLDWGVSLGLIMLLACAIQVADWILLIPGNGGYVIFGLAVAVGLLAGLGRRTRYERWTLPVGVVSMALLGVWVIFKGAFGSFDLSAVLFHWHYGVEMPGLTEHALQILPVPLLVASGLVLSSLLLTNRSKVFSRLDRWAAIPLLLLNPALHNVAVYAATGFGGTDHLAARYQAPALAKRPAARVNLLHFYLESDERTYADRDAFGDVFGELAAVEAKSLTIKGIRQAALTGWTTAGMVSSQCGTPLFSAGVLRENEISHLASVLPSAICLGDLLKPEGYELAFFTGSEGSFGGKGTFFENHGYAVFDFARIGHDADSERNWWGAVDSAVLRAASAHIKEQRRRDVPHVVTINLDAGHFPNGLLDPTCANAPYVNHLRARVLEATRCMNDQVARFVAELDAKGVLEDTVVVVQSDHLAMENPVSKDLNRLDRQNLFFAAGSGVTPGEVVRDGAMIDVFPTLLQLMGYRLEHDRGGLGASLLADGQTLSEEIGLDKLSSWIETEAVLGPQLWGLDLQDPSEGLGGQAGLSVTALMYDTESKTHRAAAPDHQGAPTRRR